MLPPVRNDVPYCGTNHIAIRTVTIKACITTIEIEYSMAMIFNPIHKTQLEHLMETLVEILV